MSKLSIYIYINYLKRNIKYTEFSEIVLRQSYFVSITIIRTTTYFEIKYLHWMKIPLNMSKNRCTATHLQIYNVGLCWGVWVLYERFLERDSFSKI